MDLKVFNKKYKSVKDEILDTTETSFGDKKVTCEKYNCPIHTISLVIICLLLVVAISISGYYYYIRHWIKKEYALPYLT